MCIIFHVLKSCILQGYLYLHVLAIVGAAMLACLMVGAVTAFGIFKYRNRNKTPAVEENSVDGNHLDLEEYALEANDLDPERYF